METGTKAKDKGMASSSMPLVTYIKVFLQVVKKKVKARNSSEMVIIIKANSKKVNSMASDSIAGLMDLHTKVLFDMDFSTARGYGILRIMRPMKGNIKITKNMVMGLILGLMVPLLLESLSKTRLLKKRNL